MVHTLRARFAREEIINSLRSALCEESFSNVQSYKEVFLLKNIFGALNLLFYKIAGWETNDCISRLISLFNCPIDLMFLTYSGKEFHDWAPL